MGQNSLLDCGQVEHVVPQSGADLGLKDQGAKLLWFNCPENLAFPNYSAKWNNDPSRLDLWHAQFNNIKQANLPTFDRVAS